MHQSMLAVMILIPAVLLSAQTTPAPKPASPQPAAMTVQHIGGGLYFVKGGSGANSAFFVGQKDVTVIDAKMTAEAANQILAEVGKLTTKPITEMIVTHSDGDHVNGLIGFPKTIKMMSSDKTKNEMVEAFKDEKMAPYREHQFSGTYHGQVDFHTAGGEVLSLKQLGPAHTSGDTVVIFPKEKAAFIGDLAFIGRDPLIHRAKGGTYVGYLAALKTMLGLDVETYLSGHADPLTKADLQALSTTLEEKAAKVKAMIAEGKTLDEIKAVFGLTPAAGGQPARWPSFIEIVYLELTEKK
jgi:cyclase